MATTVSGLYFADGINSENNPPAHQKLGQESLDGKVVMKFASIAERDAWLQTLGSAKRQGTVAAVSGKGAWIYDSGAWQPIAMKGYTYQNGHLDITTNSVGLFSVPHSLGVSACHPDVKVLYTGNLGQLTNTMIVYREFQLNNLVCMAINRNDGQGKQGESMRIAYRLELI